MFRLYVDQALIKFKTIEPLISGRIGLKVQFSFNKDWTGLTKVVSYEYRVPGQPTVEIEDTEFDGVVSTVPTGVLENHGGELYVAVRGVSGNTIVIPTIYGLMGVVRDGSVPSYIPTPITPDLDDYARKEWVESRGYLTQHQSLEDYATKDEIPEKLSDLDSDFNHRTVTDNDIQKWNDHSIDLSMTDNLLGGVDLKVGSLIRNLSRISDIPRMFSEKNIGDASRLSSYYALPDHTLVQWGLVYDRNTSAHPKWFQINFPREFDDDRNYIVIPVAVFHRTTEADMLNYTLGNATVDYVDRNRWHCMTYVDDCAGHYSYGIFWIAIGSWEERGPIKISEDSFNNSDRYFQKQQLFYDSETATLTDSDGEVLDGETVLSASILTDLLEYTDDYYYVRDEINKVEYRITVIHEESDE